VHPVILNSNFRNLLEIKLLQKATSLQCAVIRMSILQFRGECNTLYIDLIALIAQDNWERKDLYYLILGLSSEVILSCPCEIRTYPAFKCFQKHIHNFAISFYWFHLKGFFSINAFICIIIIIKIHIFSD
jgi:hypothetical protein